MKLNKSFCFMFLSVFLALTVHNTPFFENITNQIFRLNYAQLICEPVRSENRLCTATVNSISTATTLFSLLKVLKFHNQSLQWRTVCRGVRRVQPEPGSFSSTTKTEEKRDPGNKVDH